MASARKRKVNIVFVGEAAVGKTCFLVRIHSDYYDPSRSPTVGIDCMNKQDVSRGEEVDVSLWDTAGSERFRCVCDSYFRRADAVFVCFDIGSRKSFDGVPFWLGKVREHDLYSILVGLKCDRMDREVRPEEPQHLANDEALEYYETSSKTGLNVDHVYRCLLDGCVRRMQDEDRKNAEIKSPSTPIGSPIQTFDTAGPSSGQQKKCC
eukprot:TRINITY_DN45_c0_g1_i1.p1 TRINITY_DN45_c0_g1~~TRINITY_DN45_c0_g1_i1.p1  ORF type:complete len:236 (-),score=56.35 TRINITY_DN45_c0_g1_i1:1770-2393(-)